MPLEYKKNASNKDTVDTRNVNSLKASTVDSVFKKKKKKFVTQKNRHRFFWDSKLIPSIHSSVALGLNL